MEYFFKANEAIPDAFRRILIEQLSLALEQLYGDADNRHHAVHEFRKHLKRIRSLLRMIQPVLGKRYRSEDRRFRDLGRQLSGIRDAEVMLETLQSLRDSSIKDNDGAVSEQAYELARIELIKRRDAAAGSINLDRTIKTVAEKISGAAADWQSLALQGNGIEASNVEAYLPALEGIYRNGRKALRALNKRAVDENFHEWRKHIKHLWCAVALLNQSQPEILGAFRKELKAQSECLGDEHDLVGFLNLLADDPAIAGLETEALAACAAKRQQTLREQALAAGAKIFFEKPAYFAAQVGSYWSAWMESRSA